MAGHSSMAASVTTLGSNNPVITGVSGEPDTALTTTLKSRDFAEARTWPGSWLTRVRGTTKPTARAAFSCTSLFWAISVASGGLTQAPRNDVISAPSSAALQSFVIRLRAAGFTFAVLVPLSSGGATRWRPVQWYTPANGRPGLRGLAERAVDRRAAAAISVGVAGATPTAGPSLNWPKSLT